jgi:tetratricopeptide (TPR) repeat protein
VNRLVVAFALVAQIATARADEAWSVGVSAAQKASAQGLLEAGNALFLDKRYADALEQYRRAVGEWDHPAIRFNIVRCLIQLDRGVEAAENLTAALKYGPAPLEEAVYAEAIAYEKLLAKQVGDVEVRCTQRGVQIAFDGQPFATCPSVQVRRAAPGPHQVIGTRPGFLPKTSQVLVLGGARAQLAVELIPLDQAGQIVHRWPTWIPWVVLGGGLAVSAMGGVLELASTSQFTAYDQDVARLCPNGCGPLDPNLAQLAKEHADATRANRIAVGAMAVGAAATITGAVLVYLNRGRTVFPDALEPIVAPTRGGAVGGISLRF